MPVKVPVPFRKTLEFPGDAARVYAYLSDVKQAIPRNFPGVERFTEVSPSTYRWTFEKIGYSGYQIAIELETRFSFTPDKALSMSPSGSGPSTLSGTWELRDVGGGRTEVDFRAELDIELPIPGFLKGMATPLTQREITGLFERYANAVVRNFTA